MVRSYKKSTFQVLPRLYVMDTVIEAQRKVLEERERVEDALVKENMLKKPNVRVIFE